MKTISLMSQLFDGHYSSDGVVMERITGQDTVSVKGTEPITAQISSLAVSVSTTRQSALIWSALFSLGNSYAGATSWIDNGGSAAAPSVEYDTIYIRFRYSDWGQLPLSSITSCDITYDGTVKLPWSPDDNGYPTCDSFIAMPEKAMSQPYPHALWRITEDVNDGLPHNGLLTEAPYFGAFANAADLTVVRIPQSVKKIGRESFRGTQLQSVTIARDCEYYPTSFPDGCEVHFYPD